MGRKKMSNCTPLTSENCPSSLVTEGTLPKPEIIPPAEADANDVAKSSKVKKVKKSKDVAIDSNGDQQGAATSVATKKKSKKSKAEEGASASEPAKEEHAATKKKKSAKTKAAEGASANETSDVVNKAAENEETSAAQTTIVEVIKKKKSSKTKSSVGEDVPTAVVASGQTSVAQEATTSVTTKKKSSKTKAAGDASEQNAAQTVTEEVITKKKSSKIKSQDGAAATAPSDHAKETIKKTKKEKPSNADEDATLGKSVAKKEKKSKSKDPGITNEEPIKEVVLSVPESAHEQTSSSSKTTKEKKTKTKVKDPEQNSTELESVKKSMKVKKEKKTNTDAPESTKVEQKLTKSAKKVNGDVTENKDVGTKANSKELMKIKLVDNQHVEEGLPPSKRFAPSPTDIALFTGRKVGTIGQKIKVESNYLTLNLSKMVNRAYHYDIVFDPDKPKKCLRNVFDKFRSNFPLNFLAFDGWKSFYTSERLKYPGSSYKAEVEFIIDENRAAKKFQITIKEVAEIDLKLLKDFSGLKQFDKPQAAIQCLDIVLREVFNNNRTIKWHSSFFDAPRHPFKLGGGYELWIGLFQSAVLGWKPYLNIDVAHKAFPSAQTLLEYFQESDRNFNPSSDLDQYTKRDAEFGLKGFRIGYKSPFLTAQSTQYNLFNGFKDAADKQTFTDEKGRKLTIAKYFEEKGINLKYPKLPCVWVGNTVRNIYLPAEFCFIPIGQTINRKIPERCVANMIREAATSTTVRKNKIFELLRSFSHNKVPIIKGFGLTVGDKFEMFDARVLQAPAIEYSNDKIVTPQRGVWRGETNKFILPVNNINKWAIFNLERRISQSHLRDFEKIFLQIAKSQGVGISTLSMIQEKFNAQDRDVDTILALFKKEKIDIIIVIIPDNGNIYSRIKLAAETKFGLMTQCIKSKTMNRMNASTAGNILLKINTKLNGTNHRIFNKSLSPIMLGSAMVLGADVTHPSPEQKTIPSVVGVVSSINKNLFQYKISWRLQSPKDEMIRDLESIVIDSLNNYMTINKTLPSKIFYFRDGVSEGQFKEIMNIELRAIQAACGKVKPNYKPNITFIVVQKRHHTRFFPTKRDQSDGKHENVLPGTIVDTEIVHPNQFQYYLVSHASIQGVAKPTKYCVLYDDSNLSADDLQKLTYDLCHMFSRCNRAVSYPAPTYYAHLVAARGRAYIETSRIQLDKLEWEYESRKIHTNIINDHPMFFV